jgi:hypothetical protein
MSCPDAMVLHDLLPHRVVLGAVGGLLLAGDSCTASQRAA